MALACPATRNCDDAEHQVRLNSWLSAMTLRSQTKKIRFHDCQFMISAQKFSFTMNLIHNFHLRWISFTDLGSRLTIHGFLHGCTSVRLYACKLARLYISKNLHCLSRVCKSTRLYVYVFDICKTDQSDLCVSACVCVYACARLFMSWDALHIDPQPNF